MPPPAKLLIIDDEKDIANLTKLWMESKGFVADAFYHPIKALECFEAGKYDLALLDIRMPAMSGFELYAKLLEIDPHLKACFISAIEGFDCHETLQQKFPFLKQQQQQWALVKKPEALDKIVEVVKSILSA